MTVSEHISPLSSPPLRDARGVTANKPIRILHVLGGMDRGGAETWLMHVLRHIDRNRFQMDFLVHTDRICAYDEEIRQLGSNIYFCPTPSNPVRYASNFRRILRDHGPYDIVHSHVHHFSGFVLALAKAFGVRGRIAHSHSATSQSGSRLARKPYLKAMIHLIEECATFRIGVSRQACDSLFQFGSDSGSKLSVLHCGIELEPFQMQVNRTQIRSEFGFGPDDLIVGHVGRFCPEKNHVFLLRVHAEALRLNPKTRLLLIGSGPLKAAMRTLAQQLGIAHSVTFAGVRADIPRIMLGAMDVFVFPSLHEGLGLVALEAQAAGLPTIMSDRVPVEVDAGCGLVRFISLSESASSWAEAITLRRERGSTRQGRSLQHLQSSKFDIRRNVADLVSIYGNPSFHGR